ncbi:MAG: hypothetical protein Q8O72_10545 [Bacteroidales bacterium]|nr:hypothetical protein [Bacteroidales bacterium]
MNNATDITFNYARAVEQEILSIDSPFEFIKTLDSMYDIYVGTQMREGGGDEHAHHEVSHYRQLRRLLERIA